MSEYTENIRRAVKTGYDKLIDALDRMEKERDELQAEGVELREELDERKIELAALRRGDPLEDQIEELKEILRAAKDNAKRITESLQKQVREARTSPWRDA